MNLAYAHGLKYPARNRNVTWDYDESTDEVILDGQRFARATEAEDYLMSKDRLDIPQEAA